MRKVVVSLLYTALIAGANAAMAADVDILSLREGDMKKLIVHETPEATSDAPFNLQDQGGTGTLADYQGKYVLVNKDEKRKVKIGLSDYQKAEILEGLQAEETIYKPQ